jgi:hypothetical protein
VDWLFLVDVGKIEVLPVTSGESVIQRREYVDAAVCMKDYYAPPASCAADSFQLLSGCRSNELRWDRVKRSAERTLQLGRDMPNLVLVSPLG